MLFWPWRRRQRAERIDAEADALMRSLGVGAYSAARRREHEASSDATARYWSRVALAVARMTGKHIGVDTSTRMAMNAVFVPDREPAAAREPRSLSGFKPADELTRVRAATTHPFRIQFVGAASDHGSIILREVEIQVMDLSGAIVAAANIAWPPRTIGLRILDGEGREIFRRQKADRR